MRFFITATLDTEAGNEMILSGQIGPVLQQLLGDLKPEAAYFLPANGRRAMHLVVNANDPSEIVPLLEPFWLFTKSDLQVTPCMNQEDLQKGISALPPVIKKYER